VTQRVPSSYDNPVNPGLMATSLDIRNEYFTDAVLQKKFQSKKKLGLTNPLSNQFLMLDPPAL
jgi:hypothetical protein